MITAVDTSVLLDVFTATPRYVMASQAALRKCLQEGSLIICEVVVAELRPCFSSGKELIGALETIDVEFSPMSREAALMAGEAWARYRKSGGKRDRLIPDFLIAAHARTTADRFLTRDRGFFKKWFQGLRILEP